MSEPTTRSVAVILAALPDARGQLYPLPALRTLTVVAILGGCKPLTAVAHAGRDGSLLPRVRRDIHRVKPNGRQYRKLDGDQEARLAVLACSPAP